MDERVVWGEKGRDWKRLELKPSVHKTEVEVDFDGEAIHYNQPYPISSRA